MPRKGRGRVEALPATDTSINITDESYNDFLARIGGKMPSLPNKLFANSNERNYLTKMICQLVNNDLNHGMQRCIMIHGPSGTGKTTLILSVANQFKDQLSLFYLPCDLFLERQTGHQRMHQIFKEAVESQRPTLIFFDKIDLICPDKKTLGDGEKRTLNALKRELELLRSNPSHRVLVVAATNRFDSLDPSICEPGHGFKKNLPLCLPSENERKKFIEFYFSPIEKNSKMFTGERLKSIADSCKYFSYFDLLEFCSEISSSLCSDDLDDVQKIACVEKALREYKPSAVSSITTRVPNIRWCDIGGCDSIKSRLINAVLSPLKNTLFDELPQPRGILLYGPPGCSKTMMAAALANETGHNFICIKGPELFSKYVGDTEAEIRRVYERAQKISPAIIFFDEFDSMGCNRGNGNSGDSSQTSDVAVRAVQQLLTILDSLPPIEGVFTLAATNRPGAIDKALLRPGRFSFELYVRLPDEKARLEIFKIHTRKYKHIFDGDYDTIMEKLAQMTKGYSGAEIMGVFVEAAKEMSIKKDQLLTLDHFHFALDTIRPKTSEKDLKMFEEINNGSCLSQKYLCQKNFRRKTLRNKILSSFRFKSEYSNEARKRFSN